MIFYSNIRILMEKVSQWLLEMREDGKLPHPTEGRKDSGPCKPSRRNCIKWGEWQAPTASLLAIFFRKSCKRFNGLLRNAPALGLCDRLVIVAARRSLCRVGFKPG